MEQPDKKVYFRTAIGGFNKDDVIAYISSSAKEARLKREELVALLDSANRKNAELERRLAERQREIEEKSSAGEEYGQALEAAAAEMEKLRASVDEKQQNLDEYYMRIEKLKAAAADKDARIAELTAMALEYESKIIGLERAKANVAELELAAKKRAERAEDEAREKIAAVCSQFRERFEDAIDSFESFRNRADMMIKSTIDELESMADCFSGVTEQMINTKEGLKELMDDNFCGGNESLSAAAADYAAADGAGPEKASAEPAYNARLGAENAGE